MKGAKVINLLESRTDNINFNQLRSLKREYQGLLNENKFPLPPAESTTIDMIRYYKRKSTDSFSRIGPYENITVFEAANRIASDLVLINGIIQIIEDEYEHPDSIITLYLGSKHVKGHGDFIINSKHGEAFNVAESFFKSKLNMTIKKWADKELSYVLVNDDVFKSESANFYLRFSGIGIIGVNSWMIL